MGVTRLVGLVVALSAPVAFGMPLPNLPTSPITGAIAAANDITAINVTTGAYVQLIASTTGPMSEICFSNTSGAIIILATGAAASEVDRIYVPSGGAGCYPVFVSAATRLSLKALNVNATSGYFIFTGY